MVAQDSELLPAAVAIAKTVATRSAPVTKLVKQMQHVGQSYDVAGAIKYELDIAIQAYEAMGKQSSKTQAALSGAFSKRTRSKL